MNRYLFIAEKPSAMRDVEAAYKKNEAAVKQAVGEIDFAALAGHVCRLLVPKEYPEWDDKWANLKLPMIPGNWKVKAIESTVKTV